MYRITPIVKRLLIVNLIIFFFIKDSVPGARDSGLFDLLTFWPDQVFAQFKVYQLITYQYLHGSFMHIFSNMLILYFFGPEIEERLGSKRFLYFYSIAGVIAGLSQFLISPSPMIGASGSVMGVFAVFALFNPNKQIMLIFPPIPVKVKYVFAVYLFMDITGALSPSVNGIANIAHLGGALAGYLFVRYFNKNYNSHGWRQTQRRNYYDKGSNQSENFFDKIKSVFEEKSTSKVNFTRAEKNDYSSDKVHFYRAEVDRLLDKINEIGYLKLSDEERKKLEEASDYLKRYDSN